MEKSIYCTVRWSNHSNNVNRYLSVNYAEEKYTDVALACDGHVLKAHKMVLAGCSPYFENIFSMYGIPNLCIAVEGIAYPILQLVLEFMYSGEIRVKHSELESLVKAGVQLKVKGLDAIKLNDLSKGGERTTVIARPNESTLNHKVIKVSKQAMLAAPKSPQKPSDSVTSSTTKSSPRKMEPLNIQQDRLKPIQKPLTLYGPKPDATSTPLPKPKESNRLSQEKPSDSPSKQKPQVGAGAAPVSSPSKPGTLASDSKRKVGEWLDSLERSEKKEPIEAPEPRLEPVAESVPDHELEPQPQTRQTRKRANKPRPARAAKEPKVPRAVARLRGSNGVEGDAALQEPPPNEQDQEDHPDPASVPEKVLSPLNESPVKTAPEAEDAVPPPRLGEELVASAMDSEETNQNEGSDLPPSVTKKDAPERVESIATTTTRSRTIKKPARMADAEFEFEAEFVPTKKRRPKKIEEAEAENAGGDSTPESKSTPTKKRKPGAFLLFCSDFRSKLMEEFPGESRKEISKRLGILWQNLDQSIKEKYQDPEFKSNKDK